LLYPPTGIEKELIDLAKNTTPVTIPIPGMFSKATWDGREPDSWLRWWRCKEAKFQFTSNEPLTSVYSNIQFPFNFMLKSLRHIREPLWFCDASDGGYRLCLFYEQLPHSFKIHQDL
jgi:hypothetical protein